MKKKSEENPWSDWEPGGELCVESARQSTSRGCDCLANRRETEDSIFRGELKVYQRRTGHRFSLDAVLLATFVTPRCRDIVADLGTGNGVIALMLAYLYPSLAVTGLEVQPEMVDRAARNVRLNRLNGRVRIIEGDVRAIERFAKPASYDLVVCNPPYRKASSGRTSPDEEKKIARHEIKGALGEFLRAGAYLLPGKGRLAVIYLAGGLADLLQALRDVGIEPKRLRMVHSYADSEASLVLAEGVKGGKSEIKVLPPLVVYERDKEYSAEVAAILAGKLEKSLSRQSKQK
jgi:tRNA1Val (adenine37-N6)-methyltransferase